MEEVALESLPEEPFESVQPPAAVVVQKLTHFASAAKPTFGENPWLSVGMILCSAALVLCITATWLRSSRARGRGGPSLLLVCSAVAAAGLAILVPFHPDPARLLTMEGWLSLWRTASVVVYPLAQAIVYTRGQILILWCVQGLVVTAALLVLASALSPFWSPLAVKLGWRPRGVRVGMGSGVGMSAGTSSAWQPTAAPFEAPRNTASATTATTLTTAPTAVRAPLPSVTSASPATTTGLPQAPTSGAGRTPATGKETHRPGSGVAAASSIGLGPGTPERPGRVGPASGITAVDAGPAPGGQRPLEERAGEARAGEGRAGDLRPQDGRLHAAVARVDAARSARQAAAEAAAQRAAWEEEKARAERQRKREEADRQVALRRERAERLKQIAAELSGINDEVRSVGAKHARARMQLTLGGFSDETLQRQLEREVETLAAEKASVMARQSTLEKERDEIAAFLGTEVS
eukprot:jgi/Mesvir1/5248/Mv15368-RA.3